MADKDYIINNHLRELGGSDFEIVRDEPNIINWRVVGLNNQDIGKVHDLIFDDLTSRVKYVILDINGKPLNLVSRLVLIPVELVELVPGEKTVVVPDVNVGHLASLPTYEKDKITSVAEHTIDDVFDIHEPVYVEDTDPDRRYQPRTRDDRPSRRRMEVVQRPSKEEIKDEIRRDLDKL